MAALTVAMVRTDFVHGTRKRYPQDLRTTVLDADTPKSPGFNVAKDV